MQEQDWLAERFEEHRRRLGAVAYRMLGSRAEADDAVQEAWLRLSRSDTSDVHNLGAWLTTVVGRVCLTMLRTRRMHREDSLDVVLPDRAAAQGSGSDPEREAVLADSVGLALLVVLETLNPAERLAFVLHDMVAVPFDEIAEVIERSPEATRQLASRARRRVRGVEPDVEVDLVAQRPVVDAFLAAAKIGDFAGLVAVLDPDVELRADFGGRVGIRALRGAENAARQAEIYSQMELEMYPVLFNGKVGMLVSRGGEPFAIGGFVVRDGRIVEMEFVVNPERLARLDLSDIVEGE